MKAIPSKKNKKNFLAWCNLAQLEENLKSLCKGKNIEWSLNTRYPSCMLQTSDFRTCSQMEYVHACVMVKCVK